MKIIIYLFNLYNRWLTRQLLHNYERVGLYSYSLKGLRRRAKVTQRGKRQKTAHFGRTEIKQAFFIQKEIDDHELGWELITDQKQYRILIYNLF